MNINFMPYLIVWILLALVVIGLYLKHRSIARLEDSHLDVLGTASVSQAQAALDHKLESVGRWGKILTAIAFAYGLALAGLYLYQTWEQMSTIGV